MKQLTNDIYRTKQKLELLNSSGIGQLIKDFCILSKTEILDDEITLNIKKLENKYLTILDEHKQLINQLKIEFNGQKYRKVIKESYGLKPRQHTFTIEGCNENKVIVKERNLYPNMLKHIPGEISKQINI